MSESQSRFWWLQQAQPEETTLPPPNSHEATQKDKLDDQTQQTRFWSWGSDVPASSSSKGQAPDAVCEETPAEPEQTVGFWALIFTLSKEPNPESKQAETVEQAEELAQQSNWWQIWPFSLAPPDELESDIEDQASAELFKSAKLALETSRDSCHYAIRCKHGTVDAELAVYGNKTEKLPVKYNYKKRVLTSSEVIENTLILRPLRADTLPNEASKSSRKSLLTSEDLPSPTDALNLTKLAPKIVHANTEPANLEALVQNEANLTKLASRLLSGASVLPKLQSNFRTITLSTKLRLVGEAFVHGSRTSEKHLYKITDRQIASKKLKQTKKVTVISVHSFLPPKLVKSLVGQSTGNAVTFAKNALAAIERWFANNEGCLVEIDTIALEGQGTIENRVSKSLKLLENWKQEINSSDFIFVVANSIATPVAVKLVSQMLASPVFDKIRGRKFGILSMAGAVNGAYANTDSKIVIRAYTQAENEMINEIFELQRGKSALSTDLNECLSHLCSCNVKITMMGSLNDQLIPLYSATSNHIRHPNLFKCMYVDGSCDVPPFLMHLMSIALTMINVGYSDQNLVRDLSDRLQGPVSAMGSHGTIFNSRDVYDAGVRFAMETTSLVYHVPVRYDWVTPTTAEADKNLYNLPWNVRGLVNDLVKVKHVQNLRMLKEIVDEYTSWEPTTRVWRELRACFAGLEDITIDELLL